MSKIFNRADEINRMMLTTPQAVISGAEERYARVIDISVDWITSMGGREIVMLAGPSSSGKTTTAGKIAKELEKLGHKAFTISLDDFYKDAREALRNDGVPDFESVDALDLELIDEVFNRLLTTGESEMPIFDFNLAARSKKTNHIVLRDEDVIIVEGLHALNPKITDHLPEDRLVKIYISVSSRIVDKSGAVILSKRDLRFIRRMVRDYKFRNSSVENTYKMWPSVMRGEDEYLTPFKDNADIRINSIHVYEPCVFRPIAIPLLEQVERDSVNYENANHLIEVLSGFVAVDSDVVPPESLLREFIGKAELPLNR